MNPLLADLQARGLISQTTDIQELSNLLDSEKIALYCGFDPTADSLHIGHLLPILVLRRFQDAGHTPVALVGGATGMIGDPSFKAVERSLNTPETVAGWVGSIRNQLKPFLKFDGENPAIMENNANWFGTMNCLDFLRDIGKHFSVNAMLAKEAVKQRIEREDQGISFTEFAYALLQGYDFAELNKRHNVKLEIGGSDQWGNITTGTELIRRKLGADNEAFALTCPLITKADGKKFGKTEQGNIWLDRNRTTPYAFYQFWLNVGDEEAERYIKIFTDLTKEEIDNLIEEHRQNPGLRTLQKRLGQEVTVLVHGQQDYEMAVEATNILFGKATKENLLKLDEATLLAVFDGVQKFEVSRDQVVGAKAVDLLAETTKAFPSKGEMRKLTQGGGVSINKEKLEAFDRELTEDDLLDGKYLLAQKGKKNYYLIIVK